MMKYSTASRLALSCLPILGIAAAATTRQTTAAQADAHDMGGHMEMTRLRPVQPGDQERADAIVAAARKAAEPYLDYRKALADGYTIFAPNVTQHVYHFTRDDFGEAWFGYPDGNAYCQSSGAHRS